MDFRRKKLWLSLGIMEAGMVIALLWHGWQGWVLNRSYPDNTFVFIPEARFSDFTDPLKNSALPSPYLDPLSDYFPFTYWLLKYFAGMDPQILAYFFLSLTSLGLWAVLTQALLPVLPLRKERFMAAAAFLAFSYPFIFCLDRANLEMIMVLLVSWALVRFRDGHWISGLAWLFPAICLKLYPLLFLAVFIRPRHLIKLPLAGLAFISVSLLCLSTFSFTVAENWHLWQSNLRFYHDHYILHNRALGGSATFWNIYKCLVLVASCLIDPHLDGPQALNIIETSYHIYTFVLLGAIAAVVSFAVLIEREFFRRVILLSLLVTLVCPSGGDYKLLFAEIALVVLITLPGRRSRDLLCTGLLALVMIPKKEILLTGLGPADDPFCDVSIGILINPVILLLVMGLLIKDGFQPGSETRLRQRFWGLVRFGRRFFTGFALKAP